MGGRYQPEQRAAWSDWILDLLRRRGPLAKCEAIWTAQTEGQIPASTAERFYNELVAREPPPAGEATAREAVRSRYPREQSDEWAARIVEFLGGQGEATASEVRLALAAEVPWSQVARLLKELEAGGRVRAETLGRRYQSAWRRGAIPYRTRVDSIAGGQRPEGKP